ncbi:hypothetical protein Hanom_Chr06g00559851 [Helianthus anomalus]
MFVQESSDTYLIRHKSHMTFKTMNHKIQTTRLITTYTSVYKIHQNKFQQNTKSHNLQSINCIPQKRTCTL